ncbi:MAG: hypothetical protein ACQETH_13750 [Candidatus Rifleibacteriota bacterium]
MTEKDNKDLINGENASLESADKKNSVSEVGEKKNSHRSSVWIHFIWALAFVVVFSVSAIWVYPLYLAQKGAKGGGQILQQTVAKGMDALKACLKTEIKAENIYSQMLGDTDRTRKLVVFTQNVDVELDKEDNKRILNDWLPAGSAEMNMKVMGNKVQFFVPVDKINIDDFYYDPVHKELNIVCPPVEIDADMVVVQSDPEKIKIKESGSWVPFIGPDVKELTRKAKMELKNEVLLAANNELVWLAARAEAQKALQHFFSLLRRSIKEKVRIKIRLQS